MTGLIPQAFIDDVLNRTDIVELIDSHVPLKKQGANYVARCPFHSEKTPSFNVIAKKQFYHCFGCGASGNAISFLMDYLQQDFVTTIETLAAKLGIEIPRDEKTKQQQQFSKDYYHLLAEVNQYYQQQLKQNPTAIDYLKQRGISGEIAKRYQLGYSPGGWHLLKQQFPQHAKGLIATGMLVVKEEDGNTYDRYRNRIMFPIHDRRGRIIGFGGRCIAPDDKPKYLNSPETVLFQKNKELYGLHQAISQQKELNEIIVVEGYMDVIALAQHGIDCAVATLGTATSQAHIQLLSRHTKQLYFCFDGDNAGRQAAWRALKASFEQLDEGIDIRFMFLPQGHDPDSLVRALGDEGFRQEMTKAASLNQFFFDSLLSNIDISTLAGKTQLVNQAKVFLKQLAKGSYLDLLIQQLSRYTHIDSDRLYTMVNENDQSEHAPRSNQAKQVPSSLKLLITLLLQSPHCYAEIKDHYHEQLLDDNHYAVLRELMQLIAANPAITTAALIEHWRNSDLFAVMNKLASWQHPVPEKGIAAEITGAFSRIEAQAISKKIDHLLHQAKVRNLTNEEKQQLQTMIKLRMNKTFHAKEPT